MAQIVKELRVDVSQPNVFQAIVAKQHDSNSRFLKITLVDFGVKVEVPNTAKVTINANRPDGASESFKGEANNDGTITVPLAQWMLDIDGEVKCDVSVTNTEDNKRLTSTDFWLEVQKAANPNASIPLDPDGEILIIKPVTEINGNSKDTDYPSAKAVYDYGQNIVTDTQITATATGSAIAIDSANAPLQNLKLFGKTEQNGTPTPDAPVPLVSIGDSGSFSVGVYGKNLFNSTATTTTLNGVTFTVNADKSVTAVGTASVTTTFTMGEFRNLIKGETYYAEGGLCCRLQLKDGTKRYVNSYNTFTYTDDIDRIYAYFSVGAGQTVNRTVYPMLLLYGVTDTTYEQYKVQTLTMLYTLRSGKSGVTDEIDFTSGIHTQKMYKESITKLNFEAKFSTHTRFSIGIGESTDNKYSSLAMCTHATYGGDYYGDYVHFYIYNNILYLFLPNEIAESQATVNEWLTTNTPEVMYVLATPIETPLTETELNDYRHLMTNKGTTTVLSEAEMEVDYYINKPNAQAIGSLHEQINKDYFKLQQAIISTGGSTL